MSELSKFEYLILKLISLKQGTNWHQLGEKLSRMGAYDRDMMMYLKQFTDDNLITSEDGSILGLTKYSITESGIKTVADYEALSE